MSETLNPIDQALEVLGEIFIVGIEGTELSADSQNFLSQAAIGGVILFAKNYRDPEQVSKLISQIQEGRNKRPLWISVDQEGGRVQRFKTPFCKIPDAAAIGRHDSPKATFELSKMIAAELKLVGVNLNFAPVADILTNPQNPVIGNRAFGSTEEIVSRHVTAFIRGHLTEGVIPCVKHFPGHGDTQLDSHFELPRVDTPLDVLESREFLPFAKSFKAKCPFVMTAHILCPSIDAQKPSTLSSKTLQEFLRKRLKFSGIIVSDDLEMKAITDHYGEEDAPKLAIQAGCDLLIYRSESASRKAYNSLRSALENEELDPGLIVKAAKRSQDLKDKNLLKISDQKTHADFSVLGSKIHSVTTAPFQ